MTRERRAAVRFRDILTRFLSTDEIYIFLWELDLQDSVAPHETLNLLATHTVDLLTRHNRIEEAAELLRARRPDIPENWWTGFEATQPLTLAPTLNKSSAAERVAAVLDLTTIDARRNILFQLEIAESDLDLDGSGGQFAERLVRYIYLKKPTRLPALLALLQSKEVDGQQEG